MSKKSTLILLSILHICTLGICILTIYSNKHSKVTVAHISSDTKTAFTQTNSDTMTAPEPETNTGTAEETDSEAKTNTELQAQTEITQETEPAETPQFDVEYTFHFIGKSKNLNIRNAPSMDAKIIGKVPVGGSGIVLERTNESWTLVQYNDIIGFCSRDWIELEKITE